MRQFLPETLPTFSAVPVSPTQVAVPVQTVALVSGTLTDILAGVSTTSVPDPAAIAVFSVHAEHLPLKTSFLIDQLNGPPESSRSAGILKPARSPLGTN
ncbi:hypothetical protein SHIRM173S_00979 [Streptomyces hirsutus]